jgi:hypothetical protein
LDIVKPDSNGDSKPEPETDRRNAIFFNDAEKSVHVNLFYKEGGSAIAEALGALEMAKDAVKEKMTFWRMQDAKSKVIVAPNGKPWFKWKK